MLQPIGVEGEVEIVVSFIALYALVEFIFTIIAQPHLIATPRSAEQSEYLRLEQYNED